MILAAEFQSHQVPYIIDSDGKMFLGFTQWNQCHRELSNLFPLRDWFGLDLQHTAFFFSHKALFEVKYPPMLADL